MAITGSWLMTLVVALFMFIGYINHDIERLSEEQSNYFFSKKKIREIEKRKESIANGKPRENVLSWIPVSDGTERELTFLREVKSRHEERISEYKEKNRINYSEWFDLVEATGAMWFIYGIIAIGLFCFYFGFHGWYTKVQKHSDKSLLHEVKIKELTIKQLKSEIALTNRSSRARFNRRKFNR